jgi:hypothetical protein
MGILMPARKRSKVNAVLLNIATNTYDSIFYRINIYEVRNLAKKDFVNVLVEPIFVALSRQEVKQTIRVDISDRNILVKGNFLVTIEHFRNLGPGQLYFCSQIGKSTHFRKTSQGKWGSAPIAVSISVEALVEK